MTPNEINIRACVDLLLARFIKLLRTSEGRRADEACLRPKSRILCSDNFRHAVVDYLDQQLIALRVTRSSSSTASGHGE